MKSMSIVIDIDYDRHRVSPREVIFNVKKALDEYFNIYGGDYDDEAIKVKEVYEDSSFVYGGDKG